MELNPALRGAPRMRLFVFFFFNDTATTEIYTLSLHDALPISVPSFRSNSAWRWPALWTGFHRTRSEEHTSELQSLTNLVCRLLLEKRTPHRLSPYHTCASDAADDAWGPESGVVARAPRAPLLAARPFSRRLRIVAGPRRPSARASSSARAGAARPGRLPGGA